MMMTKLTNQMAEEFNYWRKTSQENFPHEKHHFLATDSLSKAGILR